MGIKRSPFHTPFLVCISVAFIAAKVLPASAQSTDDFFNSNVVHEIRIEIDPANWQTLKTNYLANTYYPCDMVWRFEGRDVPLGRVGIRQRGTGSRSPIKPGLGVDITRYVPDQTFLGLKAFVLRNNSQDASMMHEIVSMALMRRLGIPASREAYTRLYVNGDYVGLYTIVESIDKSFLQHNYSEDAGYLYSYDYPAGDPPYFFEDRGDDPSAYIPRPFSPETHGSDPAPGPLVEMITTLNRAPSETFEDATSGYVDWKGFLNEVAAESYLAEQDGILGDYGLNNFYIYRSADSSRFRFIPWDKSNTFFDLNRSVWIHADQVVMMRRAMEIPELRAFYIDALLKAAGAGGPTGWLELTIRQFYSMIADSAYTDPYKLCDPNLTGTPRPCSNEEFDQAIAFMIRFARERSDVIRQQLIDTSSRSIELQQGEQWIASSSDIGRSPIVGYTTIETTDERQPFALAIYNLRQNGVLVSRTAAAAAPLIRRGRFNALIQRSIDTAIAIANPNNAPASISFYFTGSDGKSVSASNVVIPPRGQIARLLRETPFNGASEFDGSFTFSSSTRVSVLALRLHVNERSDVLTAVVPVIDLDLDVNLAAPIIPQFAEGQGWATEIVLVNPTDSGIAGDLEVWKDGASSIDRIPYSISPGGSFRIRRTGAASSLTVGYVRIAPSGPTPAAFAIVSFSSGGVTVTESGIAGIAPDSAIRMYTEITGSVSGAVAIANPSDSPAEVRFEVGSSSASMTLPAHGHFAGFLSQAPGLSATGGFAGFVRVSTASPAGIAAGSVLVQTNERGDSLITGVPAFSSRAAPPSGTMFPQIVEGGGYSMQLIIFDPSAGKPMAITLQSSGQSGQPFDLRLEP
jgi:CotH kinase protein